MTLTELKSLLKLLRSQGVLEYRSSDVSLKLSEEAPRSSYKKRQETTETDSQSEEPDFDDLSFEDQLLYSSTRPQVSED